MPNPLEILLDPISILFSGIYTLLILWEAISPARHLPKVRYWQVKGIASYIFFLLLSTYLPQLCASWLPSAAWIDLSSMNPIAAAFIGILIYELGVYVWHRLMHRKTLLWRTFHQMHHSAERLDTFGAFYFSPMDMIGFIAISTVAISFLVVMPASSITIFILVTNFFNVFQHANIKTPVWLGYIIQRPESHSIHHAKGIHAYNYSDLPFIDMIFGTFNNPSSFAEETGFYPGASSKVKEMLSFKDISNVMLLVAMGSTAMCAQNVLTEKSIELTTGVTMKYVETGTPGNTPMILLHGYTDSWHSYETVVSKFSKEYHVMALTLRGHGASSKPAGEYRINTFSDDVASFISAKKLGPCIVVGHSLGGIIAQRLAIDHPELVSALVLVATDAFFADNPGVPEFMGEVQKLSDPVDYAFAEAFQLSTVAAPIDSLQMQVYIHESLKMPSAIWKSIAVEILVADTRSELQKITAPTLILWGDADAFCPWTDQALFTASIPHAVITVYKGVGHAIHWEIGDRLVEDVEAFVRKTMVEEIARGKH